MSKLEGTPHIISNIHDWKNVLKIALSLLELVVYGPMLLLLRWQLWRWLAGGCRVQGGSDWDQWLHGVMLAHTALSLVSYKDLVHWNHLNQSVQFFLCLPLNWQPVYCGSWFMLQTQNCSVKIFANKDGVMRHLVNVKYESLTVDKLFKLSPHHCGWLVSAGLCWHPDKSLANSKTQSYLHLNYHYCCHYEILIRSEKDGDRLVYL